MEQEKIFLAEKFGNFYNNLDGHTRSFVAFILGEIWPEHSEYLWSHTKDNYIKAGVTALQMLAPGSSINVKRNEEEPEKWDIKATIDQSKLAYFITQTFH